MICATESQLNSAALAYITKPVTAKTTKTSGKIPGDQPEEG